MVHLRCCINQRNLFYYKKKDNGDDATQDLRCSHTADAAEGGKRNEKQIVLQNLLMKAEDVTANGMDIELPIDTQNENFIVRRSGSGNSLAATPTLDMEYKTTLKSQTSAADPFIITGRVGENEDKVRTEEFQNGENFWPLMRRRDFANEECFFQGNQESKTEFGGVLSTFAAESIVTKSGREENCYNVNHSEKTDNQDITKEKAVFDFDFFSSVEGDCPCIEKSRKDVYMDDSFIIHTRSAVDDLRESPWKTYITMDTDLTSGTRLKNGILDASRSKHKLSNSREPDDLCVTWSWSLLKIFTLLTIALIFHFLRPSQGILLLKLLIKWIGSFLQILRVQMSRTMEFLEEQACIICCKQVNMS